MSISGVPTCSDGGNARGRALTFPELVMAVQACRACPTMAGRRRVLSERNGSERAAVLFLAEAPGRLGAERTGVPFSGDQSGRHFEALLAIAGLTREEVFITNSVLCNPQDSRGRNRPPSPVELRSCSRWLAAQIALVDPAIVVTLGQAALRALRLIAPHEIVLARDVGRGQPWQGRTIYPLYHPAFRARRFRSWQQQVEDWQRLGAMVQQLRRNDSTLAHAAPASD